MDVMLIPESWHIDQILDDLDQRGFSIINNVYKAEVQQQISQECQNNANRFRDAAIQSGVISHIRSDQILWIDDEEEIAKPHLQALQQLAQQLNRHFFLGIQHIEAHFACYSSGDFYALHRDNPQQKNDRVISTVYYFHERWQSDWGGQLRLQDKQQHWHILEPLPNRLVIFQSDLLHEVLQTKKKRLSITAWLRSGQQVW